MTNTNTIVILSYLMKGHFKDKDKITNAIHLIYKY